MTSENSDSFLLVGKTNDKSMNDFFHGFPNLRLNNHSNIKSISISSLYRVKAITSLYKPTKFYSENFQFHRTPTWIYAHITHYRKKILDEQYTMVIFAMVIVVWMNPSCVDEWFSVLKLGSSMSQVPATGSFVLTAPRDTPVVWWGGRVKAALHSSALEFINKTAIFLKLAFYVCLLIFFVRKILDLILKKSKLYERDGLFFLSRLN